MNFHAKLTKSANRRVNKIPFLGLFILLFLATIQTVGALSCKDINDPKKTEGKIVTVLEEEISSIVKSKESGEQVFSCIRKTTISAGEKKETVSEYVNVGDCHADDKTSCKRVQVYVASSGAELFYSYVGSIYRWAAGTIGIVSVLFMVWGGIEISTAGGDTGRMDKAKTRIMQSLAGLVLLFLSALILYTVNPNFFTK